MAQISFDASRTGIVITCGFVDVQVMPDGVFQPRKEPLWKKAG